MIVVFLDFTALIMVHLVLVVLQTKKIKLPYIAKEL